MRQDTARNWKIFAIATVIPLAIGGLSAFLTRGNMQIYSEVQTPPLLPPAILFPIAWTLLYILMGVSSAIIWANRKKDIHAAQTGLAVYALSLAFNFAWSILFFNFRLFGFSLVWLIVLWILILLTILQYRKISPLAAYLQIPYAAWVAFAGYLNAGIWWLNR
jgi:tryptophan-rich sensory protein